LLLKIKDFIEKTIKLQENNYKRVDPKYQKREGLPSTTTEREREREREIKIKERSIFRDW
jgi:hypothetical protein